MTITLICTLVLASPVFFGPQWAEKHPSEAEKSKAVCIEVGTKAAKAGIDPVIAIALSYSESRLSTRQKSKIGAVGPLQVLPRWTCPKGERKGCDLVLAGITTLRKHAHEFGCGPERQKKARKVMRKQGAEKYHTWAMKIPICKNPDWETIVCHYNSGRVCRYRRFPKLVLKRAGIIQTLIDAEK